MRPAELNGTKAIAGLDKGLYRVFSQTQLHVHIVLLGDEIAAVLPFPPRISKLHLRSRQWRHSSNLEGD